MLKCYWELIAARSFPYGPAKSTTLQLMTPHQRMLGEHKLVNGFYFKEAGTQSWDTRESSGFGVN